MMVTNDGWTPWTKRPLIFFKPKKLEILRDKKPRNPSIFPRRSGVKNMILSNDLY